MYNFNKKYFSKMDGPAQCPTSCDYMKENDDRIWCFKPGNYDFDECSGASNMPGNGKLSEIFITFLI